jgi:hypothetical protein
MYKNFDCSIQYYSTNEDIENKFTKYYDTAIPSIYQAEVMIKKDMCQTID